MIRRIISLIIILGLSGIALIESVFSVSSARPYDFGVQKYWIHHGGNPPNTIEGIKAEISAGNRSLELDVHFHDGELYLGHDELSDYSGSHSLKEITSLFPDGQFQIWVDIKNLEPSNYGKVAEYHRKFLGENYFFETQNGYAGALLSRTGVPVSLWIVPHTRSRLFWFRNISNKLFWIFGNFISVSFPKEELGPRLFEAYEHIPKLVFTFKDKTEAIDLEANPSFRILLIKSPLAR